MPQDNKEGAPAPSSPSPAIKAGGISEGGSNGGDVTSPPSPVADCRETVRVAGENRGKNPPNKSASASRQVRIRLPGTFAEGLLALPPSRRGVVLMLALSAQVGSVWNLPKLLVAVVELRRIGSLLNQCLRYLGKGGKDEGELEQSIRITLAEIAKLKRLS